MSHIEREARILDAVGLTPAMSTRKIATQEGIAHFLVWKVLHEQLLHPYHMQKVREHYHGYPPHPIADV